LSAAIVALEANPVPGSIDGAVDIMFDHLGPELSFPIKLVMANRWLFRSLLGVAFAGEAALDAMQRTTTAATIFNGGVKANVLPTRVKATVNFRILPGDTIESVREHVRRTIDDERIKLTLLNGRNPSPISSIDSPSFKAIQQTVTNFFPDAIVSPYLVVGGTDARFYGEVSENLYRFAPFRFADEDRKRIHGSNERVAMGTLSRAVGFYTALIEKTASR
jgi:carboxypeptidase PM20D1